MNEALFEQAKDALRESRSNRIILKYNRANLSPACVKELTTAMQLALLKSQSLYARCRRVLGD